MNSRAYVSGFNFKGSDQQRKVGVLSGGERNRVHLAKLLKSGGNLLLLDEPTNDLDVDTLRALEEALVALRRLRGGHLPRSLVPGPRLHPRPRLRGRLAGHVVRGQLRGLRGAPPRAARRRRRPPPPHHLQEAHPRLSGSARTAVRSRRGVDLAPAVAEREVAGRRRGFRHGARRPGAGADVVLAAVGLGDQALSAQRKSTRKPRRALTSGRGGGVAQLPGEGRRSRVGCGSAACCRAARLIVLLGRR